MQFKQFYLGCLAHASYYIGSGGEAAIIDPQRDVQQYLDEAEANGQTIKYVIETHSHADFVSGHLELAAKTGAEIIYGERAATKFPALKVKDGDELNVGAIKFKFFETPGHTPEGITIIAEETDSPSKVFTGDTLFIGDVGRPDLVGSIGFTSEEMAGMLYDSLHEKILPLPDTAEIYPAHGAGSLCGKSLSKETWSTLGEQRRSNYALQPMTKSRFIAIVTADQPDAPAYFTYDAVLNTKERPTLSETLERGPVTLEQMLALQTVGAQVLDTRDPADFAAAHLSGSVNIGLGGQFATWAGSILSRERPIVSVADRGHERESMMRLGRIGFDHVVGYLADGMLSINRSPSLTASTDRLSAQVASERLASARPPLLVDVRSPHERDAKRVEDSVSIPLNHLLERLSELPRDRPLIVHCAGGYRSSMGASVLAREGFVDVSELAGGIAAWEAAGLPICT
jgi:glyoxylase-like metal-dependent hydrolase (beta-lactamase superfamily II)/rhodanese-related sulfurtransferase